MMDYYQKNKKLFSITIMSFILSVCVLPLNASVKNCKDFNLSKPSIGVISNYITPCLDSARKFTKIDEVQNNNSKILPRPYLGKNVLVGIVDNGFDTHHPAFLDSLGNTRFIAVWNQDDSTGRLLNKYKYGTIKNHKELEKDSLFGLTGESHGTLISSCAVGSDYASGYYGSAPQAMIAGVIYSYTKANSIPDAIDWIFSIADSLNVPCVINLSIGEQYGPHDGTSLVDRTIDKYSGAGRIIVGAAGNDGESKSHIMFNLSPNESKGTFFTPKHFSTPNFYASFIDIWYNSDYNLDISVVISDTITNKISEISHFTPASMDGWFRPDTIYYNNGADIFITQVGVNNKNIYNKKTNIQIFTKSNTKSHLIGVKVKSYNSSPDIHLWNGYKKSFLSRNLPGFYDGDSSYSVNEVGGTAKQIITVGAYISKNHTNLWNDENLEWTFQKVGERAVQTSAGPTVDGRIKPDICAPGEIVAGAMSRDASETGLTVTWPDVGKTTNRYFVSSGTSISAPIVAGVVALLLEIKPTLTPIEVKNLITSTAITDSYTNESSLPNNKWGAGKLNALGAVMKLLGITSSVRNDIFVTNKNSKFESLAINGSIIIDVKNISNDPLKEYVADVVDMSGRILKQININSSRKIIRTKEISPGVYNIVLRSLDKSFIASQKVVFVNEK